jgi:hypothetical protein
MSSDIYETKESPNQSRIKGPPVSPRRNEYLKATGGEAVPHPHRRHHGRPHRASGRDTAVRMMILSLGLLALLAAGVLWWLTAGR